MGPYAFHNDRWVGYDDVAITSKKVGLNFFLTSIRGVIKFDIISKNNNFVRFPSNDFIT